MRRHFVSGLPRALLSRSQQTSSGVEIVYQLSYEVTQLGSFVPVKEAINEMNVYLSLWSHQIDGMDVCNGQLFKSVAHN